MEEKKCLGQKDSFVGERINRLKEEGCFGMDKEIDEWFTAFIWYFTYHG